jgi:hypothetical protein
MCLYPDDSQMNSKTHTQIKVVRNELQVDVINWSLIELGFLKNRYSVICSNRAFRGPGVRSRDGGYQLRNEGDCICRLRHRECVLLAIIASRVSSFVRSSYHLHLPNMVGFLFRSRNNVACLYFYRA